MNYTPVNHTPGKSGFHSAGSDAVSTLKRCADEPGSVVVFLFEALCGLTTNLVRGAYAARERFIRLIAVAGSLAVGAVAAA